MTLDFSGMTHIRAPSRRKPGIYYVPLYADVHTQRNSAVGRASRPVDIVFPHSPCPAQNLNPNLPINDKLL